MTKNKAVHFRTNEDFYKEFCKAAIDLGVTKTDLIEAAISHYLDCLQDKEFYAFHLAAFKGVE